MIALIQRVKSCSVIINNLSISSIQKGMLVFIGIEAVDTNADIKYIIQKLLKLRIFNDDNDTMNLSIQDIDGESMLVSQFTLCGNTTKGNRPSYIKAMDANLAKVLYNDLINDFKNYYKKIKTGTFQTEMDINLVNDGPVTLILRSNN